MLCGEQHAIQRFHWMSTVAVVYARMVKALVAYALPKHHRSTTISQQGCSHHVGAPPEDLVRRVGAWKS